MSAKAISEQTGKEFLYKYICTSSAIQNRFKYARVTPDTDWARLTQDHPWLLSEVRTVPRRPAVPEPWTNLCPHEVLAVGQGCKHICVLRTFVKDQSLLLLRNTCNTDEETSLVSGLSQHLQGSLIIKFA